MKDGNEMSKAPVTAGDITKGQHLPYIQQLGLCSLWQQGGELVPHRKSPHGQARTRLPEENLSLTGNRSRAGNS